METYSYTSKSGEKVEVSKEHVDTAIRIKKELQKSSPSFRCGWGQHKKMMESEGFSDSENSERYRLFIKGRQSALGELDSKEEYESNASNSKLESIKNAVGELFYTKREVQSESRKLNKLKKELSSTGVIASEIRDSFLNDIDWTVPSHAFNARIEEGSNHMIVVLSDWHVGAVINNSNGNAITSRLQRRD